MTRSLLVLIIPALFTVGCGNEAPKPQGPPPTPVRQEERTPVPAFDGGRAFRDLVAQTDFGPRNPNSDGHRKCLDFLQEELSRTADAVNIQPFVQNGYDKEVLKLTNVIASYNLQSTSRIVLLAHWDTRPRAEEDPDPKKRSTPILGANDGASGVAVLLEIGRHLRQSPPRVGIDMIFVDGEDYGKEGDHDNYLLGSRYFAKNKPQGFAPLFGILLDMVGDAQLELLKEPYSRAYAPDVVDLVWSTARNLGIPQFVDDTQRPVLDDHQPFNEAGMRTIDLIDFQYPDTSNRYWHTTQDTPDKCSAASLEAVGTVLLHVIYER
jgi:hypothetical protein